MDPIDLPTIRLRVPLAVESGLIPARTTLRVLDFLMGEDYELLCETPYGDRINVDRETVRRHGYTPRSRTNFSDGTRR